MRAAIEPRSNVCETELMESLLRDCALLHRYAVRVQVVLARLKGIAPGVIADTVSVSPKRVSEWVRKFNREGLAGLIEEKPRVPGKPATPEEVEREIVRVVKQETPKEETHWSVRALAKRFGLSHGTIHRILRKHQLKPHLVKRFRTSNDPQFVEKLADVVGVYLNPPKNAIVLCVDEKSQIQALERAQPILPLREGIPERQTHDYQRHGVLTLYAALNVASGKVIGQCNDRHRAQEYKAFLKMLDRRCEKNKVLHLVIDNVSSHRTAEIQEYFDSRPGRFVVHYIPTHSSWLNMIERWFSEITTKRIRRGSWQSVPELRRAILDYIRHWNTSGKRFVWTKSAGQILESLNKATSI